MPEQGNYVVVAMENTKNANRIFKYAIELAEERHKAVYGIYVIDTVQNLPYDEDQWETWIETQEALGTFNMQRHSEMAAEADIRFIWSVMYGDPVRKIARFANLDNVCHLVMGAYGERHLAMDLLGHKVPEILSHVRENVTLVH
ncbi:universal stress protein [Secundilactobacillus collinoides]|uniref:UspA domain-containing protein n=2 Tax=Secundilactobacillus collinoides TaxID=33960 RepID=A0A0R2B7B0_SECCO|nr:universal stress protein [Secundilactobacillus collinoides]KRM75311.1 hypothetical protein FC82_GL002500 [Secundilactobacillus collinoides DSM 20515 = JCM 1123]KZL42885.1 hypothetical protein TY91_02270 [Secundilactobacillus collinoides]